VNAPLADYSRDYQNRPDGGKSPHVSGEQPGDGLIDSPFSERRLAMWLLKQLIKPRGSSFDASSVAERGWSTRPGESRMATYRE
jgi:hypothetical protein